MDPRAERSRDASASYDFYFEEERAERPAFVTELLRRKHQMLLDLALGSRNSSSMMELGPGEGFVAREARRRGIDYVGIEASPKGVSKMKAEGYRIVEATIPPIPDSVGPVDLLYASHLIEHLKDPEEVFRLLADAHCVLTPGRGVFVVVFPDYNWMKKVFWDCDYTHQWPSTPRRVAQVAHDAGFEVAATYPCCLHQYGLPAILLRMAVKLYPHRVLSYLDRKRADFWFRGALLFAPDHLMVLTPRTTSR